MTTDLWDVLEYTDFDVYETFLFIVVASESCSYRAMHNDILALSFILEKLWRNYRLTFNICMK